MPDSLDRFTQFLAHSERSPLTLKNYRSDLTAFAIWFQQANGDAMEPGKITPTDLREYKRELIARGALKPASINRKLASLRSFLRWAHEAGLTESPAPPKVPRAEREERPGPRWLDRREQNALLRAVERGGNLRDRALVALLLNTGLRVAELCALTWRDVSLSDRKGTLTVRAGKGGKRRQVPLNRDARDALLSVGYDRHGGQDRSIFQGQRGALTPRGVQNLLDKYRAHGGRGAEREQLSPHVLRHTFCKNLIDAGVGLEKVAALAGHERLETTRRYGEPSLKDLEQAVALIGEAE